MRRKVQLIRKTHWVSIPSKYCKEMGIDKHTVMTVERVGDKIIYQIGIDDEEK